MDHYTLRNMSAFPKDIETLNKYNVCISLKEEKH